VGPVRGDVAGALTPARVHRGIELAPQHVDLGSGKVRQASGVVEVEVRRYDVAHVIGLEAEPAICEIAVSAESARGRVTVVNATPSWRGLRVSSSRSRYR